MALNPGDSFVDVGAGKAEFCVRLAARRGARCDAVERSSLMVAAARQRVEAAIIPPPGRVMVHETDATGFLGGVAAGYYAGAACVGSSHALSGLAGTIAALTRVVRRGGYVLIGEGFWNRQPTEEYLAATGIEAAEFQPLNGVTDAVSAAGVYLHDVAVATEREWDDYEWAHARGLECWGAANAGHAEARAILERSRAWRHAYLRWGRGTLGFALLTGRIG
jgi:SAM-dependent methyltransferase